MTTREVLEPLQKARFAVECDDATYWAITYAISVALRMDRHEHILTDHGKVLICLDAEKNQ